MRVTRGAVHMHVLLDWIHTSATRVYILQNIIYVINEV